MNAISLIENMVGSPPIQDQVSIISHGRYRKRLGLMHVYIICPIAQGFMVCTLSNIFRICEALSSYTHPKL